MPTNRTAEQEAEEALREAYSQIGIAFKRGRDYEALGAIDAMGTVEYHEHADTEARAAIDRAVKLAVLAQAEKMIALYEERFDREGLRAMRDEAERLRKGRERWES